MPPRPPRKPDVRYSPELAARIVAALAAGQGLRRLAREPGMPTRATIMRWLKTRPGFAADATIARFDGGLGWGEPGRPSRYTPALYTEIYDRISAGEPLRTLCRDPRMPGRSTVQGWARIHPDFARALRLARETASWAAADERLAALGFTNVFEFVRTPVDIDALRRKRRRSRRRDGARSAAPEFREHDT